MTKNSELSNALGQIRSEFEKIEGPLDILLALVESEHWEAAKAVAPRIRSKVSQFQGRLELFEKPPEEPVKEKEKEAPVAKDSNPAQAPVPPQG